MNRLPGRVDTLRRGWVLQATLSLGVERLVWRVERLLSDWRVARLPCWVDRLLWRVDRLPGRVDRLPRRLARIRT